MKRAGIAVLDFGGQYVHLIATKVRALGVYAEIREPDDPVDHEEREPVGQDALDLADVKDRLGPEAILQQSRRLQLAQPPDELVVERMARLPGKDVPGNELAKQV